MAPLAELLAAAPWPWLLWWAACLLLMLAALGHPVLAIVAHVLLQYGIYSYSAESILLASSRLLDVTALLSMLLALRWRYATTGLPAVPWRALVLMWGLAAWVAVSVAAAWWRGAGYAASVRHDPSLFLQAACLFSAAALCLHRRRDTLLLAGTICAATLLHAAHQGPEAMRLEAYVATLAVMALPLAVWLAVSSRYTLARSGWLLGAALLAAVVLWSRNRAAAAALAAGLLGAVLMVVAMYRPAPGRPPQPQRHRAAAWLGAALVAVLAGTWVTGAHHRFAVLWQSSAPASAAQRLDLGTAQERVALWRAAWELARAAPILGVGPGHYARTEQAARIGSEPRTAHSNYLGMLAESGLVSLVLYLALFGSMALTLHRLSRSPLRWQADAARALQLALIAYLVQGLFNARQDLVLAYLLAGWTVALRQASEETG